MEGKKVKENSRKKKKDGKIYHEQKMIKEKEQEKVNWKIKHGRNKGKGKSRRK